MKPRGALLSLLLAAGLSAGPANSDTALPVQVVQVVKSPEVIDYRLAGTIEAPDTIPVGFREGGRVLSVAVQVGDQLVRGDEIARVDSTQAQAALEAATAQAAAAEAALIQAATAQSRVSALLSSGVATRAELDAADQQLAATQSARDQALTQVAKARRALEETVLRAPQDVIVTAREAEPGQVSGPGQTVVTLAADARRVAVFYAPDNADLGAFIGLELDLAVIDDDMTLRAHLTEISPVVDANTGTIRIKAEVVDPPADVPLLGTPVIGHVRIEGPEVIHIPWEALTATAQGPAVWRADPATMAVSLVPITVASFGESDVLVDKGLEPGDLIVGAGSQTLYPGRVVEAAK